MELHRKIPTFYKRVGIWSDRLTEQSSANNAEFISPKLQEF